MIQDVFALYLKVVFPFEGANARNAGYGFEKVRVQWGFGFDVEETDLARGAEVEGLKDIYNKEENGNRCSKIFPNRAENDKADDAY